MSPAQPQRHRVAWLWVAADQQWYSADVVAQDAGSQTHRLVYHVNGKVSHVDVNRTAYFLLPCYRTIPLPQYNAFELA